jgi:hypothetical protein
MNWCWENTYWPSKLTARGYNGDLGPPLLFVLALLLAVTVVDSERDSLRTRSITRSLRLWKSAAHSAQRGRFPQDSGVQVQGPEQF